MIDVVAILSRTVVVVVALCFYRSMPKRDKKKSGGVGGGQLPTLFLPLRLLTCDFLPTFCDTFFFAGGGGVVLLPPLPLQMFVSSLLVTLLLVSGASLLACPFSCTLSASVHLLLAHFDRRSIARFLDINPYDCASQFIFVSAFMGSLSAAPSSCP